jgi:hypothetical protein
MRRTGRSLLPTAYDNSAISAYQNVVASGTPFTWTHNPTTAGSYALIPVFGAPFGANGVTLAATALVTFGGVTATSLGSVYDNNDATNGWIWVFGLRNAPGGSNTVNVKFTQAGDSFKGFGTSFTYLNVASVGALQTAFGTGTTPSLTVSSAQGNLVWGATSNAAGSAQSAFSLTNTRQSSQVTTNFPVFFAGDAAGAASVTVSATQVNTTWGVAGLNLIA